MDHRYEPFTRSIDNREPFQITRPNEMNIMSDIDQRIAETDRRMAELAEKEARLYAEEERYMAPRASSPYRPESPTRSPPRGLTRMSPPRSSRSPPSYSRKSTELRHGSRRRSRSRSRSPRNKSGNYNRGRKDEKKTNMPSRGSNQRKKDKSDDVIVIDDDESKPSRNKKRKEKSPEVRKFKETYQPPVVYHKRSPPRQAPPVVHHVRDKTPPREQQLAPYMMYEPEQPEPIVRRAPPPSGRPAEQASWPAGLSGINQPAPPHGHSVHVLDPPPRATPSHRRPPTQAPNPGEEDAFNADLRAAVKSGQLKMTVKEILNFGPEYSHAPRDNRNPECGIYVGNLLIDRLSKDDIYHIFEKYGEIEAISFFKLSSCYVQFTSQDAVDDAIEENGRMMHDSPIQVAPKTMSPENSRKLPRNGAAMKPISRRTPHCRLFLETDNERYYATRIERKLRCLGVTVDTIVWKQPVNRKGYSHLNKHLEFLERDPSSICAIEISPESSNRHIVTVHFFKPEGEEHRNMPVVDALLLIFNRIESLRPDDDQMPPGQVRHLMSVISNGKKPTLSEVEMTINYLEEKRVKLGGKKRSYHFDDEAEKAAPEKLTETFNQLISKHPDSLNKLAASLAMVTGNREIPLPPEPPRLPNTEKVVDYDRDQAYVHGRPSRDKYQLEPLPERPDQRRPDARRPDDRRQVDDRSYESVPYHHAHRGPPPSAKYDNISQDPALQLGSRVIDYHDDRREPEPPRQTVKDSYYPSGITYGSSTYPRR